MPSLDGAFSWSGRGLGADRTSIWQARQTVGRIRPRAFLNGAGAEDSERHIFGSFIGCVEEYFFSSSLVAHSILLYVDPKWRGSPAAVKFIHAFRKWALNRDVAQICIGVATGVTIGRTDRFLKRLGFKMTGGNYALVVKKGLGNQRLVS